MTMRQSQGIASEDRKSCSRHTLAWIDLASLWTGRTMSICAMTAMLAAAGPKGVCVCSEVAETAERGGGVQLPALRVAGRRGMNAVLAQPLRVAPDGRRPVHDPQPVVL